MAVSSGSRLGPYEIVSRIGAGGMGEVFRAKDTRLDRSVAIKVLPSHLSSDPQLRERFDREARAVSALNHPSICTLHDVGHQDGIDYIVMELLEGETLADRLAKGPLPLEQVLRYGVQIAEGLDKAHRQGIIHRDLKPGNVMLTKAGAKLLDFGLAKTKAPVSAVSGLTSMATEHKQLTAEGTIIGTFQYMAPEQLEGLEADARTDIFAFGAVLYEMVTGRRAFEGKSKTSLIAAIVDRDPPPIASLQPLTPPALERVIRTCLAKDPDDRWQTAHDVLLQLKWLEEGGSQAGVAAPVVARRKNRERLAWSLAGLLLICSGILAYLWNQTTAKKPRRVETVLLPPEEASFAFGGAAPQISPDGLTVVLKVRGSDAKTHLWLRPMKSGPARLLNGTENGDFPFWSPDSRFIGFFAGGKLKKIDIAGGPAQTLCDASIGRGGTWNAKGLILFTPTDRAPIHKVPASGGASSPVTEIDPRNEFSHRYPYFLPDGEHYLYLSQNFTSREGRGQIFVAKVGSKERKPVVNANSSVAYAAEGFILYYRDRALLAQKFDVKTRTASGDPQPVTEQLRYVSGNANAPFSISNDGTLVYATGSPSQSRLVWRDRSGKELGGLGETGELARPWLSPDGRRVAVEIIAQPLGTADIWILDIARSTATRLTFEPTAEINPIWSPDGKWIAFAAEDPTRGSRRIVRKLASGAGSEEVLFTSAGPNINVTDWSRDGRYLLFTTSELTRTSGQDVWIYSIADRKAYPYINSPFNEFGPRFSPDGRWIAYASNESGTDQLYIQSFPTPSGKWQISTSGGGSPRWRADGKELFFISDEQMFAVDIAGGETIEAGVPKPLFSASFGGARPYDITPDGTRFLINELIGQERTQPVTVIQNWTVELDK